MPVKHVNAGRQISLLTSCLYECRQPDPLPGMQLYTAICPSSQGVNQACAQSLASRTKV